MSGNSDFRHIGEEEGGDGAKVTTVVDTPGSCSGVTLCGNHPPLSRSLPAPSHLQFELAVVAEPPVRPGDRRVPVSCSCAVVMQPQKLPQLNNLLSVTVFEELAATIAEFHLQD